MRTLLATASRWVLLLSMTVACSGPGADSTSSTRDTATTLLTTSTTDPDGSLDCLTAVSFISIPDYFLETVGEPTPRAAAERYAELEGRPGELVEIEPHRFAIIEQGREVVLIEVSEAPADGYLAGPMRGCA